METSGSDSNGNSCDAKNLKFKPQTCFKHRKNKFYFLTFYDNSALCLEYLKLTTSFLVYI